MLKLKKIISMKGFTLVELLIVIAVIGILAVAVLAALDPVEQLKKSRDTGRLADARELVGAFQRFAVANVCFPDEYDSTATPPCTPADITPRQIDVATPEDAILNLEAKGEIKSTFKTKSSLKNQELWISRVNDALAVCFNAESKNARSGSMGTLNTMDAGTGAVTQVATPDCASPYDAGTLDDACMVCVQ